MGVPAWSACCAGLRTQGGSTGDTVIFVSCYVEGLQVGSILLLNEDTYEVAAIAVPSGRRRLAAVLPKSR